MAVGNAVSEAQPTLDPPMFPYITTRQLNDQATELFKSLMVFTTASMHGANR
jgi:hypothetical protein